MNDKQRLQLMMSLKGTEQHNVEVERSKCQICLGSTYCCKHRRAAELHGREMENLICVCGKNCKYERTVDGGY